MDGDNTLPLQDIPTKALVVEEPGAPFVLKDIILDGVRDGELLVEIVYTGICHTDLVVQQGGMPIGTYPAILGHEGAGIIRRVGHGVKDARLTVGQAVLLTFSTCKACSYCLDGCPAKCPGMTEINFGGGRVADGSSPARLASNSQPVRSQFFGQSSFSKLTIAREQSVVPYDGKMEALSMLAPLGCGYNTGAGTVFNVLKPIKTTSIAVTGTGAVGFAALMAAKATGVACIIAVDVVTSKLDMARELGASHVINSKGQDISSAIREILPDGVDQIVDTTGITSVIEQGIAALSHGGTMALVGVPQPDKRISIDPLDFLLSCKQLVGVIAGTSDPQKSLPHLMQLAADGNFPVEKLGRVYPVTQFDQAVADLKAGKVIKPILSWEDI